MNFNQLKYIVAVERHRSFNRAADECEVAQSTLSKEIQRLEKEFGIIIFDRSRFPITPTMKGADLIHQASIILDEQRSFAEIARKMNNKPAGNFHLAISTLLAPYLLPLFISSLSKKYPELNLEIEELGSKEILALFEEGNLDGAIILSPFIKEGYYEEPLFKEDFVLYISPRHHLYSQTEISWPDIPVNEILLQEEFRHDLLHYDDNENYTALNLNKHGNINYHSGSLETIRKVIDRNGGLTLLPKLACLYMGERRLEMVRPITAPKISKTVSLVTPRGFEKNRITKAIKKELLDNLPKKSL